jgi:hypothetical protein
MLTKHVVSISSIWFQAPASLGLIIHVRAYYLLPEVSGSVEVTPLQPHHLTLDDTSFFAP